MLCFGEETARSMYSFFCYCPFQFSPHNLKVACQKQNARVKQNEARTKQKKKKKEGVREQGQDFAQAHRSSADAREEKRRWKLEECG